MGLFDIFTGDPMKEAAQNNRILAQENQKKGLGYLDAGYNSGTQALNTGIAGYTPLANLGANYAKGGNLYLDALGVNGPEAAARARSAFTASPGYQYQLGQGLQAIDRGAASKGLLSSGNTLMSEQKYGNDLANQDWGNYLTRLGGMISPAITATSGAASGKMAGYGSLANLASQDALNRLNLNTTTTSALMGANNQDAQAKMSGSGNIWNFGLNAAKVAAGFL